MDHEAACNSHICDGGSADGGTVPVLGFHVGSNGHVGRPIFGKALEPVPRLPFQHGWCEGTEGLTTLPDERSEPPERMEVKMP